MLQQTTEASIRIFSCKNYRTSIHLGTISVLAGQTKVHSHTLCTVIDHIPNQAMQKERNSDMDFGQFSHVLIHEQNGAQKNLLMDFFNVGNVI